jgi:uncharacterized membrane protein (DUF4010 family)
MSDITIFYRLGLALGIGFIIGLQREHSYYDVNDTHPAGVRTFAISGLLGALLPFIGSLMGTQVLFFIGFILIGLLLMTAHFVSSQIKKDSTIGLTTSLSMLLVFLLGALCWYNRLLEACAIMVCLLSLLSFKEQIHSFAQKLSKEDILATIKFAVIAALVLPFLPNEFYGPKGLEVLNPFNIGLFVVFISGISFIGYVLVKVVGPGKGIGITGILGGIASSTALTLNLTQRSQGNGSYSGSLAMGVILSWSVMYLRLYIICSLLNPSLMSTLAVPMLVPMIPGLLYAGYLKYRESKVQKVNPATFTNPFELMPAIKFGLIFTVVLFIANAARVYFGNQGLLISSFVAGFADMDAIALSVIEMNSSNALPGKQVILAILFAGVANTLTKGSMVVLFGEKSMKRAIIPAMVLILSVTGGLIGLYW